MRKAHLFLKNHSQWEKHVTPANIVLGGLATQLYQGIKGIVKDGQLLPDTSLLSERSTDLVSSELSPLQC